MDITDYTSYDEIRLLLGMSPLELDDSALDLPLVGHWLTFELEGVYSGLVAKYEGWMQEQSPTSEEEAAMRAVQLFAPYAIAKTMKETTGSALLRSITDGRAKEERFNPNSHGAMDLFRQQYLWARRMLIQALIALGLLDDVPAAPRVFFGTADLVPDPVVGEEGR